MAAGCEGVWRAAARLPNSELVFADWSRTFWATGPDKDGVSAGRGGGGLKCSRRGRDEYLPLEI